MKYKVNKMLVMALLLIGCLIFPNITVKASQNVHIQYKAHVQYIGWQNYVHDNKVAGTTGKALRVEAMQIKLENRIPGMKIIYQPHVQYKGWMNWVKDGQVAGTTGKGLRLEALKIKLEGAPGYHVEYQAHVQYKGWMNWVKDGQVAGTIGKGLRLEALKIRLVKDAKQSTNIKPVNHNTKPVVVKPINNKISKGINVQYQGHVQYQGWQNWVNNGQIAGTTGKGLRVEAIRLNVQNLKPGMSIQYQGHVQYQGWQNWVNNGQIAGTTGKGLRLEALKIVLKNPQGYHIQYQAHVQNIGWMNWVQDGQVAGTTGRGLRVEAIRIKISKNSIKPKKDSNKPKIGIDIGHNVPHDTGASAIRTESVLNKEVGTRVINKLRRLGYEVINCTPSTANSTRDSLQRRVDVANKNHVDIFVSIHFNAGGGRGTEIWIGSEKSKKVAQKILKNITDLGYANRGVKIQGVHGKHLYVLKNTNAPALLVECAFVDSKEDMKRYNPESLANAIVNGIVK